MEVPSASLAADNQKVLFTTPFTWFASIKVQILTHATNILLLRYQALHERNVGEWLSTQKAVSDAEKEFRKAALEVLSLRALLVQ